MAVKSGDTGDGRYARSRDKWRRILRESERDAEAMQQAVVALEAEQGRLRCKAQLLSVIVEGLGVVIHYMMRIAEKDSAHLKRLQQLEHQIQQLIHQASEGGAQYCSSSSSGHELLYGNVARTTEHYSTALLISWFQPEWINKVISMSDAAIVARLRELVSKSAILAVKGGVWNDTPSSALRCLAQVSASAATPTSTNSQQQWSSQQPGPHSGAAAASGAALPQCRDQSHHQRRQQQHYETLWQQHPLGSSAACTTAWQASCHQLQQQQHHSKCCLDFLGSAAFGYGSNSAAFRHGSNSAAFSHGSNSAPSLQAGTSGSTANYGAAGHLNSMPAAAAAAFMANGALPAPLEYVSILMTLMLLDQERFWAIQFMNLEDMSQLDVMPPEFWAAIASKLELTADQVEMLQCMSTFMEETLAPLFKSLGETAQEGLEVTQKQEQQQLQQQLPQQQQELLHAQESLLKRQHNTLQQWQIWGLQMGILSINTLTLHQMGLLQVFSYPNCPRMDMVLKDLATLPGQHRQQQPPAGTTGNSTAGAAP